MASLDGDPATMGVGIGLRAPHVQEVMATAPAVGWVEVHAENYMMAGGSALRALERIRRDHAVSLHGVGLSLGSADGLDQAHLERLASLVGRIEPVLVSEHLSWSVTGGAYLNHLLPLPWTEETLAVLARHVETVQARLGRQLLVENPSSYLRFPHSTLREEDVLRELTRRTGCALLCDVNNVVVSAANLGFDPVAYLDRLPAGAVREIHLAGHSVNDAEGRQVLIDDHGSRVGDAVWRLYAHGLDRFGPVPTLVEWDTNIPALAVLLDEARTASRLLAAREPGGVRPAA